MTATWLLGCALLACIYVGCAQAGGVVPVVDQDGGPSTSDPGAFVRPDAGGEAGVEGYEETLACVGTECPYPYATCPAGAGTFGYKCGANLLTDSNNCGKCGSVCPSNGAFGDLNMTTQCIGGQCRRLCSSNSNTDFVDCNGQVDDGCEVDLRSDLDNCGACGRKCPEGTAACINGDCGCPSGLTLCGCTGACSIVNCVDLAVNSSHCGACGNRCTTPADAAAPPPNMVYGCVDGECGQFRCSGKWADCNGEIEEDGCEVDTGTDPNNCGGCGNKCAPGEVCYVDYWSGPRCGCAEGETLCPSGSASSFVCVDLQVDAKNCGVCGNVCPGNTRSDLHMFQACRQGFCDYECTEGWGDCDGVLSNGCETNLLVNTGHCGACGNRCDASAGQPCVEGKCLMVECDGGEVPR